VGARPASVAIGADGTWIAARNGVSFIKPHRTKVAGNPVDLGSGPKGRAFALALSDKRVWVTTRGGLLFQIGRDKRRVIGAPIEIPSRRQAEVAVVGDELWVNHYNVNPEDPRNGLVYRIDPCTRKVTRMRFGGRIATIRARAGFVWMSDDVNDEVIRYNLTSLYIDRYGGSVLDDAQDLLVTATDVWIVDSEGMRLYRLRLNSRDPDGSLDRPENHWRILANPGGIALGAGAVWVPGSESGGVTRVQLDRSARVVGYQLSLLDSGEAITDVAVGHGKLWFPQNLGTTIRTFVP